jgi:hypothetical protein
MTGRRAARKGPATLSRPAFPRLTRLQVTR